MPKSLEPCVLLRNRNVDNSKKRAQGRSGRRWFGGAVDLTSGRCGTRSKSCTTVKYFVLAVCQRSLKSSDSFISLEQREPARILLFIHNRICFEFRLSYSPRDQGFEFSHGASSMAFHSPPPAPCVVHIPNPWAIGTWVNSTKIFPRPGDSGVAICPAISNSTAGDKFRPRRLLFTLK